MKQIMIFIVLFVSFSSLSWAQVSYTHQITKAPESSRYEIIQSQYEFSTKISLKLDKYTGYVYELVKRKEGLTWQLISAEVHSLNVVTPDKVNFQIFLSDSGNYWTFLINVNTGITWRLLKDPEVGMMWSVVE